VRRLVPVVLASLLAASAVPAWAALKSHVVVTGHGTLAGGAGVAVAAFEHDERAGGVLRVESAPGFLFVSKVTCVEELPDGVLVGGVIVRSPTDATLGSTSLVKVVDGGPAGPDLLGIAFSRTGLDACPVFALPLHAVQTGKFRISIRSG
jgi:hypothetical protein